MEIVKQLINMQFAATKALIEYNIGFAKGMVEEYEKQVNEFNKRV